MNIAIIIALLVTVLGIVKGAIMDKTASFDDGGTFITEIFWYMLGAAGFVTFSVLFVVKVFLL